MACPAITHFVVANFRKHKLPFISEEGFFFFFLNSSTEGGWFSHRFSYDFHTVVQMRTRIFFFHFSCSFLDFNYYVKYNVLLYNLLINKAL